MIEEDVSPRGNFGPITVLCVHPDADEVAARLGEGTASISAVPASTRADAVSRFDSEGQDCILSAQELPDSDGVTLLEDVREEFDALPFVLVAERGSESVAAEAVNAGVDGYFQVDDAAEASFDELRERIETVVEDHRTRKALAETRKRLLMLAESSHSAVWMFTADWSEVIYVNSTYEDIWGRSREVLEENPEDFLQGVHPEDRSMVQGAMGVLAGGEAIDLEYRVNPNEDYQRWVQVQGQPVTDHTGDVTYIAGFARDVTERKEREQQLSRQNQEMEVFNSLLRHDVLNGITVIRTRADVLADELDGEHRQYAETIVEWSDNMTGLVQRIRDVLDALTGEDPELERVNLSRALQNQVETLERSYPDVTFGVDVPDGVFVAANDLLSDVFKNLLTNAVDHNDREGLRIEGGVEVEPDTVTVRIADNGTGIPDEHKDEVFRRGATGHVKQTGSGFGLFFVDAMVTAYGGSIEVADNEMGGATFVIEFPTSPSQVEGVDE